MGLGAHLAPATSKHEIRLKPERNLCFSYTWMFTLCSREHAAISIPPPHGPLAEPIFAVYDLTLPPPSHWIQSFRGSPATSRLGLLAMKRAMSLRSPGAEPEPRP